MTTIFAFIVTIGLLVTIHEFGHYLVARWCDVRVLRFSVGFGKPLFTRQFSPQGTEFILAAIPLGGYVKMLDERELKQAQAFGEPTPLLTEAELAGAFNRKTVFQRMAIVLAGPLANLLLAVVLYWALFVSGVVGLKPYIGEVLADSHAGRANFRKGDLIVSIEGMPVKTWQEARWALLEYALEKPAVAVEIVASSQERHVQTLSLAGINQEVEVDILEKLGLAVYQPEIAPVVGEVLPSSVAANAGFQAGDRILSIDRVRINNWEQVVRRVQNSPAQAITFELLRGTETLIIQATPQSVYENGVRIGRLGASAKIDPSQMDKLLIELTYTPWQAVQKAVAKTWETSRYSLTMLANMVMGKVSWSSISGPVSIASFAGESAGMGLKAFVGFLALVSISIGVLNLLPIPMLDGGHLMYYIAELIKGTPVSEQAMIVGQKIGIILLGFLMMIALFNDINRFMMG